jgi:amidophosphoribosyltransferase
MPSRSELVAYHRNPHQIAEVLGADLVVFQTLPDLINSVQQFNPELKNFDCSVFTGDYVTGDIDERYLAWVEDSRSEKVRLANQAAAPVPIVSGKGTLNGGHTNGVKSTLTADEEAMERREVMASCSGPMNGADDIGGLHNTFKVGSM